MMIERRWQLSYDPPMEKSCYYCETSLKDEFIKWVRIRPDKPYILSGDQVLTYQQTNLWARRLANALLDLGVAKGDRVSLTIPNIPQYVVSSHACMKIGAILVPLNPLYTRPELVYHLNDSGAETLITVSPVADKMLEIMRSGHTQLKRMIVLQLPGQECALEKSSDIFDFDLLTTDAPATEPNIRTNPDDIVILLYTGGTTGVPKGCCLTNRNFVAFHTVFTDFCKPFFAPDDMKTLCTVPMYHIYGFNMQINVNLGTGGTMVLIPEINTDTVLEAINKHEPTYWPTVPAMIQMLNLHPDLSTSKASSIGFLLSGSAPLPLEAMNTFEQISGSTIVEGFGMTETTNGVAINPKTTRRPGSVGVPFPDNDMKIVDMETGTTEMPAGEPGELILKGPLIIKEYWNKPEETANSIRDGWLYTGDIAYLDDDGFLYIVGRKKEMIISSGFNVYPREIDEVLYAHPKILEAGAIGIPDPIRGESVKVFVVCRDGESLSEEEVISHCRQSLAAYKVPRCVEFIESIPRTNMKKVDRRALKEMEEARR